MKKILLKLIDIYQKTPLSSHSKCKYYPTCSEYAKEAITIYGSLKGTFMTIKRILKCNPFSKGGIDLVPKKGGD
jgi:putative membrane protein insertion efficiency factor